MSGIENLYVIKELDEFVLKEYITAEERDELKEAFINLDKTLSESNELESNLRFMQASIAAETKTISSQLERKKDDFRLRADAIDSMRAQYKDKELQLDNIDTQILLMGHEIITKEGERNRLRQELDERRDQEAAMVQPRIDELERDIDIYSRNIANYSSSLDNCKKEKDDLTYNTTQLEDDIYRLDKEVEELTKDATEKKSDPASYDQYRQLLVNINAKLSKEKQDLVAASQEKDRKIKEVKYKVEQVESERKKLEEEKKKNMYAEEELREELGRLHEELKKKLEQKQQEDAANAKIQQDIRHIKEIMQEKKSQKDLTRKSYLISVKDLKRKENYLRKVQENIASYHSNIEEYVKAISEVQKEVEERSLYIAKLDSDLKNLEDSDKSKNENLQSVKEDLRRKKEEFESQNKMFFEYQNKELIFRKEIKQLIVKIERSARQAAQCRAEYQDAYREGKIKDVMIFDLAKKLKETQTRHRQYEVLYEEIKNSRNKKVLEIQNSSQDLADMKDRLKILNSEVEILREESAEKEKSLTKAKHNVQVEINIRDNLRSFLSKQQLALLQKKTELGRQVAEIEKLNANIDLLENEMKQQRRDYEEFCKQRNLKGVQLIDRNDELCILYETSNMLEEQIRSGEKAMSNLNDDMRMLNIQLNDHQRTLELLKKQMVQIPDLSEAVVKLKAKTDDETNKVAELTTQLENPDPSRRRELKSEQPDPKALETKISVYEELLNMKKEHLLEKDLIFEEITMKSDELRKRALDNRERTIEIADRINKFQGEIKKLTKKRMALISELSMFQALSLKQEQNIAELKEKYVASERNLEEGADPSEELMEEWNRMERIRIWKEKDEVEQATIEAGKVLLPPGVTKSHADPRPNAYYSVDYGIPVPYGAYAPFKPSEPGANMRFFRKPKEREIEL